LRQVSVGETPACLCLVHFAETTETFIPPRVRRALHRGGSRGRCRVGELPAESEDPL